MVGSAAKRRFQNPWLSMTSGWAPAVRSSSGANARPIAAPTPSTSK